MPELLRSTVVKWPKLAFLITILGLQLGFLSPVFAAGLSPRSWQGLSSAPGDNTTYTLTFTVSNSITLGSLDILFCSNDPLETDSCSIPTGMDVTNTQLTSQSGVSDFSLGIPATNQMLLSRTASYITAPTTISLTFSNIINPTVQGPYYVRVAAFSSSDGSGSSVAYGGLAFYVNGNLLINSIVSPYLIFCSAIQITNYDCTSATGNYIDFGDLSSTSSSQNTSQIVVATNAPNGYVMQVYGSTMTSGNNIINALTTPTNSQPGTSQFGLNLRANTTPLVGSDPVGPGTGEPTNGYDLPNRFKFNDNDVIVSSANSDNLRKYTVSYLVNVSKDQAPGVYVSTITYVCAGSF